MRFAAALSTRAESVSAAKEAAERALARLGAGSPDLALCFVTGEHVERASDMAELVGSVTGAGHVVTVSASGVIGDGIEVEGAPGVSLMLASLPGVRVGAFRVEDLPRVPDRPGAGWHSEVLAPAMRAGEGHAAALVFCDPFSVPMVRTLPAMSEASGLMPVMGGFASAGKKPGENAIGLGGDVRRSGGIGVSLAGAIHVEGVVSQGCKAIGPTMVVTKARDNVIQELGGRRAVEMLKEVVRGLPVGQRVGLARGMLLGRVINEYRDRFGQGDFLIRGVHSIDASSGSIIANDFFRVGQTVQIHIRDAATADADLGMLLDAQRLRSRPEAGLVFTCVSRGRKFFGQPHHDASAIARAFSPAVSGEQQAKSGTHIDVTRRPLPLAGFFADGEFGPVSGRSYLHTMTTGLALVRRARPAD